MLKVPRKFTTCCGWSSQVTRAEGDLGKIPPLLHQAPENAECSSFNQQLMLALCQRKPCRVRRGEQQATDHDLAQGQVKLHALSPPLTSVVKKSRWRSALTRNSFSQKTLNRATVVDAGSFLTTGARSPAPGATQVKLRAG
jgi:hypothetical protein